MFLQPPREATAALKEADTLPELDAARLRSVLSMSGRLLNDGLSLLGDAWTRLPRVKVRLRREGRDLQTDLAHLLQRHANRNDELASFLCRCGGWYVEVRLLKAGTDDTSPEAPEMNQYLVTMQEFLMPDPDGNPPDIQDLADAVLDLGKTMASEFQGVKGSLARLEGRVGNMEGRMGTLEAGQAKLEAGQADLRDHMGRMEGRMGTLETGQADLRDQMGCMEGRMEGVEDKLGNMEGRMGNRAGAEYEDHFRSRFPNWLRAACADAGMAQPADIVLVWDDRRKHGWEGVRQKLGLPYQAVRLQDADFIFCIQWGAGTPDQYLVGECSHTVDSTVRDKLIQNRAVLREAGLNAHAVLVGSGMTRHLEDEGGAAALKKLGIAWLERDSDLDNTDHWHRTDDIELHLPTWRWGTDGTMVPR